ncbi:MAG: hypothetical protein HDR88_02495 [Bacteroides sp.]|nr:hypothetical protein [Bacteroides sp.]
MVSNRVKRNIWLTLAILSVGAIIDRVIRVVDGSLEWWSLLATIAITAFCIKFYLCYRKQVKEGNLFGQVDPLKR